MGDEGKLKEAVLWEAAGDRKVRCKLCHFRCVVDEGQLGHCAVRKNVGGTLYALTYDKVCAANPDPIEKKPLFHFQPGTQSFSIAAMGCNFQCAFCQNWKLSQAALETGRIDGRAILPQWIVSGALDSDCKSIAYTYTEPTVFMELCNDCGRRAKDKGLANVFVSNGYMTRDAIDLAADWLDGINVDLKAFSDDFYQRLCKARLQPVLDTITHIARETKIWIEVTTLLVPGQNDSPEELKQLADWLVDAAGPDVPWHISRFHPQYKVVDTPVTPLESLQRAERIGKEAGLRHVYLGNVPGSRSESTFCYKCGRMLIERQGYRIVANAIKESKCPDCDAPIAGFQL